MNRRTADSLIGTILVMALASCAAAPPLPPPNVDHPASVDAPEGPVRTTGIYRPLTGRAVSPERTETDIPRESEASPDRGHQ